MSNNPAIPISDFFPKSKIRPPPPSHFAHIPLPLENITTLSVFPSPPNSPPKSPSPQLVSYEPLPNLHIGSEGLLVPPMPVPFEEVKYTGPDGKTIISAEKVVPTPLHIESIPLVPGVPPLFPPSYKSSSLPPASIKNLPSSTNGISRNITSSLPTMTSSRNITASLPSMSTSRNITSSLPTISSSRNTLPSLSSIASSRNILPSLPTSPTARNNSLPIVRNNLPPAMASPRNNLPPAMASPRNNSLPTIPTINNNPSRKISTPLIPISK